MFARLQHFVFLPVLALLAGCAKPVTYAPTGSAELVEQERQTQSSLAKAAKQQAAANQPVNREQIVARVKEVGSRVQQASFQMCRELYGNNHPCSFDIAVADKGGLNAYADGQKVVIFPEMVQFTKSNEELALVLAHELAHNVMSHSGNTKQNAMIGGIFGSLADMLASSQGINTGGGLSKLGMQGAVLAYSSKFENEADYVGLYIMARAGYDISKAPEFWRRMAVANPDGIYVGTTHPTTPERFVNLQQMINEIQSKQAAGKKLLPEMKKA